jgi:adenylate cyclase
MEAEYQRSESLLANILPASIAERLKNSAHNIIADKYDDASILFADIAGYTKRASATTPTELVRFLDALYTDLDALLDRHDLEKVKTSGDSYMVVSGVPLARPDHLQAHDAYRRLNPEFSFDDRGDIDVKGKGVMHTWYLTGRRAPPSTL